MCLRGERGAERGNRLSANKKREARGESSPRKKQNVSLLFELLADNFETQRTSQTVLRQAYLH